MRNEKISSRQLWFILFMMRSTIIVANLPVLTSADALQDAWMSALITFAGSELLVFLIALLCSKFPDKTLVEFSNLLLGRWLGSLPVLVFLWVLLQISVVDIRIYGEVLVTGFFPNTPLLFIISLMVLPATLCVLQGVEVLARAADVLFFLFVVMLLATVLIPIKIFNYYNLQPVLVRGWGPVIRGSITPIALISQVWVLGMLTPVLNSPRKVVKIALTSIGLSLLVLAAVAFITIGALSPQEASRAIFPLLTLIRSVQLTSFLQRLEVLLIFSWGFGIFITVSTFLYCGARGFSQFLGFSDHKHLVWPMATIWAFMAVHGFRSSVALDTFLSPENYALYGYSVLVGPLILLWLGYFWQRQIKGRD
ncbi:MAG: endospore germination permease [Halanaerobium sp.]|nr:endospore germination permease [Halanaerobium sp.]